MRRDDDHIRQFVPVLRRIVILVAVLTAAPVVMWTVTAMVRSYVGPPKMPVFRPAAVSTTADTPGSTAAAAADEDEDEAPAAAASEDAAPADAAEATKAAPLVTIGRNVKSLSLSIAQKYGTLM